jgi:hypothetical protein
MGRFAAMRRLTVDELEPIARDATRSALEAYAEAFAPYRDSPNLTMGTVIEDDVLTFQLYIAAERPADALVLTSTRVSRANGEVLGVDVHLSPDGQS